MAALNRTLRHRKWWKGSDCPKEHIGFDLQVYIHNVFCHPGMFFCRWQKKIMVKGLEVLSCCLPWEWLGGISQSANTRSKISTSTFKAATALFNAIYPLPNWDALRAGDVACCKVTQGNWGARISFDSLSCQKFSGVLKGVWPEQNLHKRRHSGLLITEWWRVPCCVRWTVAAFGFPWTPPPNRLSGLATGLVLFGERISRRCSTVHGLDLSLNPQTRPGVLCTARFDEQSRGRRYGFRQCHWFTEA